VGTGVGTARDGGGGVGASGIAEEIDTRECAAAGEDGAAGLGGTTAGLSGAAGGLGGTAVGLGGAAAGLGAAVGIGGGAAEGGGEVGTVVGDGRVVWGVGVDMASW
jgi:hypothetical protein